MKISTRGRYGVRLLIDLAVKAGNTHISLQEAAERQHIPVRYLEQIASQLRKGGFIRSVKGPAGGYELAKPASSISVGAVLRVLEGDLLCAEPPLPGESESLLRRTVRASVFNVLDDAVASYLDSQTISTLIAPYSQDYSSPDCL